MNRVLINLVRVLLVCLYFLGLLVTLYYLSLLFT